MKQRHNHNKNINLEADAVTVHFEFFHPTAKNVCVAGSFNNWQPEAKILHHSEVGKWWKDTAIKPGVYEYCFIVDGQWISDPKSAETIPNPFGGRNSILKVGLPASK